MTKPQDDTRTPLQKVASLIDKLVSSFQEAEATTFPDDLLEDLTLHEAHVLKAIPANGIRMSDLAKAIGISSASMTVAIDRLEKKSYVSRERNAKDRRVVMVVLNDRGRSVNAEHDRVHKQMAEHILRNLNPEERVSIVDSLSHILHALEKVAN